MSTAERLENICGAESERITALFESLDLNSSGLGTVREAYEAGDLPKACRELVSYYRNGDTAEWLREDDEKSDSTYAVQSGGGADQILNDTFTFYTETDTVPRREDGGIEWSYRGPSDDREWAWALNRHFSMNTLMDAWYATGEDKYIEYLDAFIIDWVLANPQPEVADNSAAWRILETGVRFGGVWPDVFYGLQQADAFSPAARILMLSSVHEHGDYLVEFGTTGGNWGTLEMWGLARLSVAWPEFKNSAVWADTAASRMERLMVRQFYPDGAQSELTSHYHKVAVRNGQKVKDAFSHGEYVMSDRYNEILERGYNYLAYIASPQGFNLLNNDSDHVDNREYLKTAATEYNRPDWRYIVTNGAEGEMPVGMPSQVFPWAGHLVMRDSWNEDALHAWFDFGPLGTGHWHYDKLHFSMHAFGRDIITDSGRFTYVLNRWHEYAISTRAHNTVMLDGYPQGRYQRKSEEPLDGFYSLQDGLCFAASSYDDGYIVSGNEDDERLEAAHTRAVAFIADGFWVVADHVRAAGYHNVTAHWNFHPDCTVQTENGITRTIDEDTGNAAIVPSDPSDWDVELIEGVDDGSRVDGWYSVEYNQWAPSVAARYEMPISCEKTFAWIITPSYGPAALPTVERLDAPPGAVRLSVEVPGMEPCEVAIRVAGDELVRMSGGYVLDGRCAVLGVKSMPVVALGRVIDGNGDVVVVDE